MRKLFIIFISLLYGSGILAQVNMQTGSANFELPMLNWNDTKSRLNVNVELRYNSGNGLRTNDVASNCGQGWNLLAGGSISRMQVGLPDDQPARDASLGDPNRYPAGYLYHNTNIAAGCPSNLTRYPIFKQRNQLYKKRNDVEVDRELDYFAFQFNGRTGMFVLDKATNKGVSLGDSKLKISFTHTSNMSYLGRGVRTTISGFEIQDENGLIYKFNKLSYAVVLKSNYCDPSTTHQLNQPGFHGGDIYHESSFDDPTIINPYIVDGWYLSEIEDALTHRIISFNYNYTTIFAKAGSDLAYYATKNYAIITHNVSKSISPEIQNITMPDGHVVNFNYGKDRIDLNGSRALSNVDIIYNNRYVSKFQLNTTYFIKNRLGNPHNNDQKLSARLCLQSVVQFSADLKGFSEPYIFDYYTGAGPDEDIVPQPFSPLKDIWGYYNGTESRDVNGVSINPSKFLATMLTLDEIRGLCYLRNSSSQVALNPKNNYAKNGLLRQIQMPTGGNLTYEYEQNTGLLRGIQQPVGGVHVSRTSVYDGNDCSNPLVTNYSYSNTSGSESSLWGLEDPKNMIYSANFYEPESKYWTFSGGIFGTCRYRYQYPGILLRDQAINLSLTQEMLIVFSEVLSAVGTVMSILDIISVISGSTGVGVIISAVISIITGLYSLISSCTANNSQVNPMDTYYNTDFTGINPLPAQFNRVVVTQGDGSNGKTVFTFTHPGSTINPYPLWETSNNIMSKKQRYANWVYGLPEQTSVYDASGNKIKETTNVYSFTNAKRSFVNSGLAYPSCKCLVVNSSSLRIDQWTNNAVGNFVTNQSNADLKAEIYDIYTGRTELVSSTEKVYNTANAGNFLQTTKKYFYNTINYQVNRIETVQSNGITNITKISFSCDYNSGVFATLNNANLLNLPVKETSSILRDGPPAVGTASVLAEYILGETFTTYSQLPSGDIKPLKVLAKRTNQPTPVASWSTYNPSTPSTLNGFIEQQMFTYDVDDNLVKIADEGGRTVQNFYDYNDKYVTAVAINGGFAYTSFETEKPNGWEITGVKTYTTNAVTGNRALSLISTNMIIGNEARVEARATFWASVGNTIVLKNGGPLATRQPTLLKSGPTINGFTYYEYNIPADTELPLQITGIGIIDELRLYDMRGRMKTTTYDPIVGKTAECDENNRITYYEYDDLGRMRFIKDEYRNITKMYEYNKKKTGCVVTYYNKLIVEKYTKNNCGSGFIGSDVNYTIPAGKYSSTVSQYEADMKADAELASSAQAYANANGTCIPIYYNVALSESFLPETCPDGYQPSGPVTYSVAAGVYSSTVSQAVANALALVEIRANGQNYANNNPNCIINVNPVWEANEPATIQCGTGANVGYKFVLMTDVNPNSSSYNSTLWVNMGLDPVACPVPVCTSCTNEGFKCIAGVCELGLQIWTGSEGDFCTYHYEWSDGTQSSNYDVPRYGGEECLNSAPGG